MAWCREGLMNHCPTASACVFPEWTEAQCQSEVHNWLGFAYRSESEYPGERTKYEEKGYAHYHKSLCRGAGPSHHSTEVMLADYRAEGWTAGPCALDDTFDPATSRALLPEPVTDSDREKE